VATIVGKTSEFPRGSQRFEGRTVTMRNMAGTNVSRGGGDNCIKLEKTKKPKGGQRK